MILFWGPTMHGYCSKCYGWIKQWTREACILPLRSMYMLMRRKKIHKQTYKLQLVVLMQSQSMVIHNCHVPKRQMKELSKEKGKHPRQKKQQMQSPGSLPWSGLCLTHHPHLIPISQASSQAIAYTMSFHFFLKSFDDSDCVELLNLSFLTNMFTHGCMCVFCLFSETS